MVEGAIHDELSMQIDSDTGFGTFRDEWCLTGLGPALRLLEYLST